MRYEVMDKTKTESFIDFLKYVCHKDFVPIPRDAYLVLDNHPVHKAKLVKEYAASIGLNLLYLPPTASELNPIERMWAYFKTKWRDLLSDPENENRLNMSNIDCNIEYCLKLVAHHGKNLASGPIKELVQNCQNFRR